MKYKKTKNNKAKKKTRTITKDVTNSSLLLFTNPSNLYQDAKFGALQYNAKLEWNFHINTSLLHYFYKKEREEESSSLLLTMADGYR